MNEGFYKYTDHLLYAPNFVVAPTFELRRESKDDYSYPVDGWTWYDTLEEACLALGLNIDDYTSKE